MGIDEISSVPLLPLGPFLKDKDVVGQFYYTLLLQIHSVLVSYHSRNQGETISINESK